MDSYSNQCYQYSFKFVFVLGLGMKIEGVALGTLIAQYLGLFTALVLWYIYYRKYISFIKIKEAIAFDKMKEFLK